MTQSANDKATILLVDDENLVRWSLNEHLSPRYHVLLAGDGREALEIIQAREDIDLLVTDIKMGTMDGLTLIEEARRLRPGLGAMIMTAYDSEENITRAKSAGVLRIVIKPFAVEEFETAVADSLEASAKNR